MKASSVLMAALELTLGTFVAVSRAYASIHPLGIEESFQGVFHQLYAPVEGFKHKQHLPPQADVPYGRLLEVSDAVLEFSPRTARDLAHLKPLVEADLISSDGWEEFKEFEDALGRNLRRKGVFFSPGMRRKIYVVGAGLMWHQGQHVYDSQAPHIKSAERAGGAPLETIEAEKRAWAAGCGFWNAGNAMNLSMGGKPYADAFSCGKGFPAVYHCKYNSTAELVIMTTYKMKLLSRLAVEDGMEAASTGAPGGVAPDVAAAQAGLELELAAYCAEFERAVKGNPLSLAGLKLEWNVSQCIEKAIQAVNAPGWKASKELCPAREKWGTDEKHAGPEIGL
ncbi:MAG: hypothetical protein HY748_15825 [Elusimicrobia bacterium]|nr:hypothetical protein [Elusimicrobiota bacterium]